ncbi:DUF4367 domain-containing protein [Blautia obeum]|jgi:hypothetical protein|uniref:DUF4367 domain-containing protein n=1 Tax=Blautia TaxID=572511 RepID=UPI00033D4012|nr:MULTISPECIES: DUF4367 domain-containing protein [Blautia]NSG39385.1 DUF4367 domain-containing protein [Blautia obeum]CDB78559.1 uncharacterized protein BN552_00813 [Blautia sp. CAG:237]
MRKEFEENEESENKSENKSENNLETQDEIDDETFQKILEKEFIEREKRITAALFADDDVEDIKFTKEELDNSYQEFLRRIEREKKENTEFSEELVPDVDAVRRKETALDEKRVISIEEIRDRRKKAAEREMREEVSKEANMEEPNAKNRTNTENRMNTKIRTTGGGLHRLGKVVGMAVVCVACVFAASMTSEANRKYLVNSVRVWSGDDTKTVVDNDDSNEKANVDEDEAIADIKEKLGVEMPIFYWRPQGLNFKSYELKAPLDVARIEYEYEENIIVLYIDKQSSDIASNISSMHGDKQEIIDSEGTDSGIVLEKIENKDDKNSNYVARWYKNNVEYVFSGKIDIEELKKILKNMKF